MEGNKDKEAGKGRNVVALGFVSLFTDVSSEMVFGLLPLFLTAELGASKALLGLVEGTGEMLGYTSRLASGTVSDMVQKRKPLVLVGYAISAASKPFFGFAASWTDVVAVRSADRVGKGIRTAPRDALISESVHDSKVGRAFGIHRSMDQAGAIVGPLLAFSLFPFVGFQGIFYLSLLPAVVAIVVLILFVRDKSMPAKIRTSIMPNLRKVLAQRRFIVLLAIMAVFSVGAFNFSFVIIRASDLGVPDGMVLLVYATINGAHTVVGFPAGVLADRIGREKMLAVSYIVFLASTVLMLTSTASSGAYLIAAVYGIYFGISETVQRALVPKYVSEDQVRGTAYGLYNMVIGVSFFAANIVFGFLLDSAGIAAAATYSMITSAIAIAALATFQFVGR
ncbi:MAG: MFS transporter [Nitrososphaera sp.]